ncbi:GntR family transcriptional regulator [uncultured Cocleimonas sp.]|uniref:GntR family transcriptional regulator n=1 Tax=uncultured Cocleimonas sp. TaxID=1051587 RepID=UPI002638066D|nr:GntR family transcriptional regulator [uncultured Cocleimonas sp.]
MPIQPIVTLSERQTLSEQVYNDLKEAIIAGDIAQGAKITEDELAKKYGISRGPLREALRRLESIRLLTKIPHAGMRVITLTPEMIEEIYIVREALEGMSARLAAERMTDEEIEALHLLLHRHANNIDKSDGKLYLQREGDLDFHFRIAQASNNQWLMDLLSSELYQLLRMCRHRTSQAPARPIKALAEHKQIVEAIASRDAELAEMLMRRHISGAWKTVKQLLNEELSEEIVESDQDNKTRH